MNTELKQYEEWKPIKCYEGLYECSNIGRIVRLPRITKTGRCLVDRLLLSKEMRLTLEKKGYYTVTLRKDGKSTKYLVHRLIALSFLGECELKQVNHKDGNKQNNNIENLEWCTPQYNTRHAFDNGLAKGKRGFESNFSRHSEQTITKIRQLIEKGESDYNIGLVTGVSRHTVKSIRTGKMRKYESLELGIYKLTE